MEAKNPSAMQEFKSFILKGNVVDLAVAVVIAVAFGAVINAMVDGILMPLIAAIVGQPSFDSLTWTINSSPILYGAFITQVVNFLIVGAALFVFIKTVARMQRPKKVIDVDEKPKEPSEEVQLLTQIRDSLSTTQTTR